MKLLRRRSRTVGILQTTRLSLVPITPALLEAEGRSVQQLGHALGSAVPASWPPEHWEPHVRAFITMQCSEQPDTLGWHRYVVLRETDGSPDRLIGCVGAFPKREGEVEIGYSTLPDFQRRGYATEAARAVVEWLLAQKSVQSVTAQTYATLPESIKVMQRCGMSPAGAGDEANTVRYRRTRA